MKIKTSITLSSDILKAIDHHKKEFNSRSEFLEAAARSLLAQIARAKAEKRDLEIIDRHHEVLNKEAEDVLGYQVPL